MHLKVEVENNIPFLLSTLKELENLSAVVGVAAKR